MASDIDKKKASKSFWKRGKEATLEIGVREEESQEYKGLIAISNQLIELYDSKAKQHLKSIMLNTLIFYGIISYTISLGLYLYHTFDTNQELVESVDRVIESVNRIIESVSPASNIDNITAVESVKGSGSFNLNFDNKTAVFSLMFVSLSGLLIWLLTFTKDRSKEDKVLYEEYCHKKESIIMFLYCIKYIDYYYPKSNAARKKLIESLHKLIIESTQYNQALRISRKGSDHLMKEVLKGFVAAANATSGIIRKK